jgi:putative ABC transport system substrate-binding protein
MNRRELIAAFGGAAATLIVSGPRVAGAQQPPKVARIGLLIPSRLENPSTRENFDAIRQGLADLGYAEGQNIVFELRGGNGTPERLAELASELVSLKVDVIVAIATPAARAAQRATTGIPIVVGSVGDPVQDGFVASLSHPGGNITGTTFLGPELVPSVWLS